MSLARHQQICSAGENRALSEVLSPEQDCKYQVFDDLCECHDGMDAADGRRLRTRGFPYAAGLVGNRPRIELGASLMILRPELLVTKELFTVVCQLDYSGLELEFMVTQMLTALMTTSVVQRNKL